MSQLSENKVSGQSKRVQVYDTTLRDGTQGEGFNLSLEDKLSIALKLDELGVDFIEGGFPLSNPKDTAFFKQIREKDLKNAKVSAFGMTRRRGIKAEDDPGMRALLDAQTPAVTIVGKTNTYQVEHILNVSLAENLQMIGESIALMHQHNRQVIYDAEHFFDQYKADRSYAIETLMAARDAGASVLVLCDTNGGSMSEFVADVAADVVQTLKTPIGVHTHNDAALAIANAMAAVHAGVSHVQGTINGVGERCGNMDLIPLIANLVLKYGYDCLKPGTLNKLTEISRFVYETANQIPASGQPYVGASAFAHKGGMHVHAIQKDPSTYEHVKPESIGNARRVIVSELSGVSNIVNKAGQRFHLANDKAMQRKILHQVQDMENAGYQFEAAEGSFELLIRKNVGQYHPFFELEHYRVIVLKTDSNKPSAEASVKLKIAGGYEHRVAEGDGPVNALDAAMRRALRPHYPEVENIHLTDYKVRVINSRAETAAIVRTVIECKRTRVDGTYELFGTIGVNVNIIDASWSALVDAYEYHLLHVEEERAQAKAPATV